MIALKKAFSIRENDFIRAGEATIHIKTLLKTINLDPALIRRIAICCYEGEMNVVMHGICGELKIEITHEHVTLTFADTGPGIENIDLAMTEGYSTATDEHRELGFGAGMGLPNMKKNSDQIQITSELGQGTTVCMTFFTVH
jgi:serine/threonine-protein kinase RsbT